jgi:hypothetical protein
MADFWHASIASAFQKGDTSWIDALPDVQAAIAVFDGKMRYLAVSRRFLSDYELGDPAQVIGRSIYETFSQTCRHGGARFISECWPARN